MVSYTNTFGRPYVLVVNSRGDHFTPRSRQQRRSSSLGAGDDGVGAHAGDGLISCLPIIITDIYHPAQPVAQKLFYRRETDVKNTWYAFYQVLIPYVRTCVRSMVNMPGVVYR